MYTVCIQLYSDYVFKYMLHEGQLLALGDYILLLSLVLSHGIPENIQQNSSFLIGSSHHGSPGINFIIQ